MTNKLIKCMIIVIIICISINLFSCKVYSAGNTTVDNVIQGAQSFLDEGKDSQFDDINLQGERDKINKDEQFNVTIQGAGLDKDELKQTSDFIFNLLLAFAMIAAVVVGLILGIQFMISSVEEKAKVKEALVPYVVSCVVIFGAFGIWQLAVTILSTW